MLEITLNYSMYLFAEIYRHDGYKKTKIIEIFGRPEDFTLPNKTLKSS